MNCKITPSTLSGSIHIPASKSEAHRILICAALSNRETAVICPETNQDIDATADCLRALGADIVRTETGFIVTPIGDRPRENPVLDCGESGSTLRFLLPVCAALGVNAAFTGRGRLPQRPLSPLYELLSENGCTLSPQGAFPLKLSGKLRCGEYSIAGDVSSQFISGLLMALPAAGGESNLTVTGKMESAPYISITEKVLADFGRAPKRQNNVFSLPGGRYISRGTYTAGGDWSSAAFWLCAGALNNGGLTVTGIDPGSAQGDKAVLDVLRRFGADVTIGEMSVTVSPGKLTGIRIDASDIPDLVPILSVVACAAQGETVFENAGRLRIKESDRLQAICSALGALGAEVSDTPDTLTVTGSGALTGGRAAALNDHRIAMMCAVASIICRGSVTVTGAQCVRKSYPAFFEDFKTLGGIVETEVD